MGLPASRSSAHMNAARVLPELVGATTSVLSPLEIDAHAPTCAGVGVLNAPVNHSRMSALNPRRGSGPAPACPAASTSGGAGSVTASVTEDLAGTYPSCLVLPTFRTAPERPAAELLGSQFQRPAIGRFLTQHIPTQVSPSAGLRLLDTSAPGNNLLSGAFLLRLQPCGLLLRLQHQRGR